MNQSVKRNLKRFQFDFMFQLSEKEWKILMSQFVISKWGGTRKLPYALEQGVAMLSGLLNSDIAIEANITIMRAFVRMRELATGYSELKQQLDTFMLETNLQFNDIYQALTELAEQNPTQEIQ